MSWQPFFRIDSGFATTAGTSVTAIARNPNHIDLFVTGNDGGVHSAYWDSASGWSSFFRIDPGFSTPAGASVSAIARNPNHIDLFVTGSDGGVHSAYWDSATGWSSFFRIDAGFSTPAGASVSAIARNPNHIDLFVTGSDGGVHSAYWDSATGWSSFFRIDAGFSTPAGTSVTAVARNPNHIDLFVTGSDGGVHSAYWDSATGWSSFFRIDAGFATIAGTSVGAIARNPNHIDLFVTGNDGGVHSAYWASTSSWSSFLRIDVGLATAVRALNDAIARYPDLMDLFVTGNDGGVHSAYWSNPRGWSSFFRIDAGFGTAAGGAVTAIARYPDHIDLFVTGNDGGVHSAYWNLDALPLFPPTLGLLTSQSGWRTTWSQIVAGRFSPSKYEGLLFYEQSSGYAEFYNTDGLGGISLLKSHSGWRTTWTHVVRGRFHRPDFTGLLFYDQASGFAAVYDTDGAGNITLLHEFNDWRTTWTHITTIGIPGSDFSGILLYDQAAGHGEILACDGSGGFNRILSSNEWRNTWTHIVGDFFSSNAVFFYEGSTSHGEAYAVAQDPTSDAYSFVMGASRDQLPPATAILAANFANDPTSLGMLFYDRPSGTGTFVFYDDWLTTINIGPETYSGWRSSWDIIVPGDFWGSDVDDYKFQDGFSDLLFYDGQQGSGEFYFHEPVEAIPVQPLEGFVYPASIVPGETIQFYVNSRVGPYTIQIYRQDIDLVLMATIQNVRQFPQPFPIGRFDYRDGPSWPPVAELTIPSDWPSALYLAHIETPSLETNPSGSREMVRTLGVGSTDTLDIPFVVRAANPGSQAKILVYIPDTTWAAYNWWGGRCLYGFWSRCAAVWNLGSTHDSPDNMQTIRATRVALARPYIEASGFLKWQRWEVPLLRWLAQQGIAVELCTLTDIHKDQVNKIQSKQPGMLQNYRLVVSVGHDEYWSKEARDNVESFVAAGGNAAFFSGNVCWWQIRFEWDSENLDVRKQLCYKDDRFDPLNPSQPNLVAVNWYDYPVCRAETTLTGVSYYNAINPADQYNVLQPNHWVFDGLNFDTNSQFGSYTGADGVTTTVVGYETDKFQPNQNSNCLPMSPSNFIRLAEIPGVDAMGVADDSTLAGTMGIFTNGKGTVFTAGTIDWSFGLGQSNEIDQITRNVLTRLG